LIISSQTFSIQLGTSTSLFYLSQYAISFCILLTLSLNNLANFSVSQTSFSHISTKTLQQFTWSQSQLKALKNTFRLILVLSLSLDNSRITQGKCLERTRWSSPLDLTIYLYYFTSGYALLLHDHMFFQNILWSHDLIMWYDYSPILFVSLFLLYDLMLEIKCSNAWETLSFLGLS